MTLVTALEPSNFIADSGANSLFKSVSCPQEMILGRLHSVSSTFGCLGLESGSDVETRLNPEDEAGLKWEVPIDSSCAHLDARSPASISLHFFMLRNGRIFSQVHKLLTKGNRVMSLKRHSRHPFQAERPIADVLAPSTKYLHEQPRSL